MMVYLVHFLWCINLYYFFIIVPPVSFLKLCVSLFSGMTCQDYVSQCVFPSSERLVLYNHVFNLHREELDEDEQVERNLLGKVCNLIISHE